MSRKLQSRGQHRTQDAGQRRGRPCPLGFRSEEGDGQGRGGKELIPGDSEMWPEALLSTTLRSRQAQAAPQVPRSRCLCLTLLGRKGGRQRFFLDLCLTTWLRNPHPERPASGWQGLVSSTVTVSVNLHHLALTPRQDFIKAVCAGPSRTLEPRAAASAQPS